MSVITQEELASRGATSLAAALTGQAGLEVSDYGASGAQKKISIRGSTSNEVLVLVDGRRVNSALSELADVSGISLENVERVEVIRSGASALYGADAVGGVVNIVTKKKAAPLLVRLENSGSIPQARVSGYGFTKVSETADLLDLIDGQELSFSANPRVGQALTRFSGSLGRADNSFTYIDSNGEKRERQNADYWGAKGSLGASLPLGAGELQADAAASYRQAGSPGTESAPSLSARETDGRADAGLRYSAEELGSGRLSLAAALTASAESVVFRDGDTGAEDGAHYVYAGAASTDQRFLIGAKAAILYGASASYAQALSDTLGNHQRINAAAYLEPVVDLGSFCLRPALRYDYYSDFFAIDPLGGLAGSLGLSYKLPSANVLRLSLGRSYRVPSFEDLYWPSSSGVEGNASLKPESGYHLDLGYSRETSAYSLDLAAFARYAQNVILWQEGIDGVWRPSNYGTALYPGLEAETSIRFLEHFALKLNYTFLYSFVLDDGYTLWDDKRLPMTPVHSLNGELSYSRQGFSWSASAQYKSLRYLKTANVAYLPSFFTLNLYCKKQIAKGLSLYAAVDNLFDEQYELVSDYPMPGIQLRVGGEYTFE
jgi:outer membrane cobalamin receptor